MKASETPQQNPHRAKRGINSLPNELIDCIVALLDLQDLTVTSRLNKRLHHVVYPVLYSIPLTTKFKAGYILRTLVERPELGMRFRTLYLEKPDDWFAKDDGPILERVDLRDILKCEHWLVLNRTPWGHCLRQVDNWDATMGALIRRLPNLETLHVGYHGNKSTHLHRVMERASALQRKGVLDSMEVGFSLSNLRSITHHTNDSSVTLSHIVPFLTLPSLESFTCEGVKSKDLGTFIYQPMNAHTVTLMLCALHGPDLKRFLPKFTALKSLTLQNGNYEQMSQNAPFPLSSILKGLKDSRHCLEELKITDLADWGSTLDSLPTCSLRAFPKIHTLEIQTEHFFGRPLSESDLSLLFNFTYLPPALENLILRVTHVHLTSQIRDELAYNLQNLYALPMLKSVHTKFLQQDQVRRARCWPRLTRRYLEGAGVKLSFDFVGGMFEPEIVVFEESDNGWLMAEEEASKKGSYEGWEDWGSDVATTGWSDDDEFLW